MLYLTLTAALQRDTHVFHEKPAVILNSMHALVTARILSHIHVTRFKTILEQLIIVFCLHTFALMLVMIYALFTFISI